MDLFYLLGLTNNHSPIKMAQATVLNPSMEMPKIWGGTLKLKRREEAIIKAEIMMDTDNL